MCNLEAAFLDYVMHEIVFMPPILEGSVLKRPEHQLHQQQVAKRTVHPNDEESEIILHAASRRCAWVCL